MKTKIFRFLLLLFLLILFLGISSCGFLPSGSTSGDSLEHTCKFDDSWMANEVHHWHICRCGKTDEKVAHSGGIATETERAKCEVCGLSYGYLKQPESPKHECDFTGSFKFDGTHHWYECSCGEIDTKVEHSGGNATCTSLAICGVCGQEYGSLLNHEYIKLNHDETNHWYECECGEVKPNSIEEHSGGEATTEELAKCVVCKTPYGELEQPEELTIGEKIQAEYDALKAGTTTNHTTWTFKATIVDMTETKLNSKYNTYNVLFIAKVDDVLIGVYNGQVGGKYPTTIDGLTIGSVVTITGIIAEKYTMTSGSYSTNIEFSMPEISWTDSEIDEEKISEKVITKKLENQKITYTDLKRHEIDFEPLIVGLIFIIPFSLLGFNNVSFVSSLIGMVVSFCLFFIFSFFGMGGGDMKLIAVIGLFLGWQQILVTMFLSFYIGAFFAIKNPYGVVP